MAKPLAELNPPPIRLCHMIAYNTCYSSAMMEHITKIIHSRKTTWNSFQIFRALKCLFYIYTREEYCDKTVLLTVWFAQYSTPPGWANAPFLCASWVVQCMLDDVLCNLTDVHKLVFCFLCPFCELEHGDVSDCYTASLNVLTTFFFIFW